MRLYMTELTCQTCKGYRLNPKLYLFKSMERISGKQMSCLFKSSRFLLKLNVIWTRESNCQTDFKRSKWQTFILENVGLDYLTLSRASGTLSGEKRSESDWLHKLDRIFLSFVYFRWTIDRIASTRQRSTDWLIKENAWSWQHLVVVEHDEDTMWAADYLIDVGPGPENKADKSWLQALLKK